MLLMLASCGKDDNPAYQDATDPVDSLYRVILGDWKLEQETRVVGQDTIRKYSVLPTLTFFANGTFPVTCKYPRFTDKLPERHFHRHIFTFSHKKRRAVICGRL